MSITFATTLVGDYPPYQKKRGKPRGSGKVEQLLRNVIVPALEYCKPGRSVSVNLQYRGTWERLEARFPELEFRYSDIQFVWDEQNQRRVQRCKVHVLKRVPVGSVQS